MFYQIQLTGKCNLSCKYCMQSETDISTMSDENILLTCNFLKDHFLKQKDENPHFMYNITGGEPLLYFDKIKIITSFFEEMANEYQLPIPYFEVSSNLTLIDDEIINYLSSKNCVLYVGCDGIEKSYNVNRVDRREAEGKFTLLKSKLDRLYNSSKFSNDRIVLNIVIAANNVEYLTESFKFLYERYNEAKISINIAYNTDWNSENIQMFEREIFKLSDFYCNILNQESHFVLNFFDDQVLRNINNNVDFKKACSAGIKTFGVQADGNIMVCGNFIGTKAEDELVVIGDIWKGIKNERIEKFQNEAQKVLDNGCDDCALNKTCYNFCPFANYMSSYNGIASISSHVCDLNKIYIESANNIIMSLSKENYPLLQEMVKGRRA